MPLSLTFKLTRCTLSDKDAGQVLPLCKVVVWGENTIWESAGTAWAVEKLYKECELVGQVGCTEGETAVDRMKRCRLTKWLESRLSSKQRSRRKMMMRDSRSRMNESDEDEENGETMAEGEEVLGVGGEELVIGGGSLQTKKVKTDKDIVSPHTIDGTGTSRRGREPGIGAGDS
jgi:hypothetical protein